MKILIKDLMAKCNSLEAQLKDAEQSTKQCEDWAATRIADFVEGFETAGAMARPRLIAQRIRDGEWRK